MLTLEMDGMAMMRHAFADTIAVLSHAHIHAHPET